MEAFMKRWTYYALLILILFIAFDAGPALAWDSQWKMTQGADSNRPGSGTRDIEMRPRYHTSPMTTFRGTIDGSSGYAVMRNLNGNTLRGYIDKDGSSLLRDQDGNFHRVNARW
jgi:hypothetical protein